MRKVAILAVKIEVIHQEIIDVFTERLRDYSTSQKCEIEIFETRSVAPSLIEREVRRIIENEFDLIVPLGPRCAIIAKQETLKRRYKTPIVFTGTHTPESHCLVKESGEKDSHITGVAPPHFPSMLPLQLVIRIHPKAKHFVIPFRDESWNGRIRHEAVKMGKYLRKFGREVSIVSINPEDNFEKRLIDVIREGSIVAPPTGTITSVDLPILENICKKYSAILLGYVDGILPKTALFAHKDDVSYMGFRTAEYAGKILFEGVSPKDLPIFYIKNDRFRQLILNQEEMVKHGIAPLEDDLLATLHNNADRAHLPFYYYSVLDRWSALHGLRLYQGIKQAGQAENKNATYQFRHIQGDPYDQEYIDQQLAEAQQPFFNGVITFHQDELFDAQRHMLKTKTFMPIMHVGIDTPSTQEPALNNPAWPARSPIKRLHLAELNPTYPIQLLDLLQLFRQTTNGPATPLQRFGLIYSADPDNLPPRLKRLIDIAADYLAKDGRQLIHDGAWNNEHAIAKAQAMVAITDAMFLLEGFVRPQVALKLGKYALQKSHMVCGAGISIADAFIATYGIKEKSVGQHAFNIVHTMTHQEFPSSSSEYFSSKETYGAAVDTQIAQTLDIHLPEGLCTAIEHNVCLETTMHQYIVENQLLKTETAPNK